MNQSGKVIITDKAHNRLQLGLEEIGYQVDYNPDLSLSELHTIIPEYDGVIINSKMITDRSLLDRASRLKFIGRLGSGLEIIDLEYAAKIGVKVYNSPEGNCNAVAEHAMGMLLMLLNKLHIANGQLKQFDWNREANRGSELSGKTVGIIGFGHTGKAFAQKLAGWNVKVLAYDKYKKNYADQLDYVHECAPAEIKQKADVISFHLPLTEETTALVDADYLRACKQGVIVINTSRGQVIRLEDLLHQLKSEHLGGACLDVFENEKMDKLSSEEKNVMKKLFQLDQVVVSPHVAGWTHESLIKIADSLLAKIKNGMSDFRS